MKITTVIRIVWAILQAHIAWIFVLLLDFIGFFVVPFAILFGHDQLDITGTMKIYSAPKYLWLWGNQQEGYDAPLSKSLHPNMNTFLRRYLWAAWRNKTSNFRFLGLFIPTKPIKVIVGNNWKVTYSGWLVHWFWEHPKKNTFTAFGARIDKIWSIYGANFAMRYYAKLI